MGAPKEVDASHPYRWVMLGAIAFVYGTFGFLVGSLAPLASAIRDDLGLSRSAFGLAVGAWPLIYIVSSPTAGRIIDRIGVRRAILLGGSLCVVSGVLRAAAQGLPTLWLAVAVFGIGGPLISAGAPKLVSVWFDDPAEQRVAIGIYAASPAVGGTMVLFATNSVLVPLFGSWRTVLLIDAAVMAASMLVWLVLSSRHAEPGEVAAGHVGSIRSEWTQLLRSPGVRLALMLGLGTFFVNHGLSAWLPSLLEEERAFTAARASNWVAVSALVGVASTILLPRLAGGRRAAPTYIGAVLLTGAAVLAVALVPDTIVPVAVISVGVRAGLISLVLVVLFEAEGVDASNMGAANGMFFSLVQFGGVAGPLTLGWIADRSVGFTGSLIAVVGVCALLAAIRWVDHLRRRSTHLISIAEGYA